MRPMFSARIDVSDQKDYVQQAAWDLRLERKSIERAEAGAKWFDRHASSEWRLRLMRVSGGCVLSRVNFRYNKDYPLGLAFATDKRYCHVAQETRWAQVAKDFKFETPDENSEFLALGFHEREWRHGDVVVPKEVDIEFLNFGWYTVLGNFHMVGSTQSVLTPIEVTRRSGYNPNLPGPGIEL